MAFEDDLETLLGNLVAGRCYPVVNDADPVVSPYIVYQVFELPPLLQGQRKVRVQIDVYGTTYNSAKATAGSVETAMDGPTFATTFIAGQDLYEEVSKEYRELLEYYVWP